jgi:CBS domain containing-hemolysin-like protein
MAEKGVTRMPVIERDTHKLLGLVSLEHVLKARARHQEEELRREQTLWLPYFTRSGSTRTES